MAAPFAPPIGAERFDLFVGRNRHRQFSGVGGASLCRLDIAPGPEPEPQAGREFEHDEVRRGIERLAVEQPSVKISACLRLVDIEQDEVRHGHWDRSFLEEGAILARCRVRFCQQSSGGGSMRLGASNAWRVRPVEGRMVRFRKINNFLAS
jgi:hypothetical protein